MKKTDKLDYNNKLTLFIKIHHYKSEKANHKVRKLNNEYKN